MRASGAASPRCERRTTRARGEGDRPPLTCSATAQVASPLQATTPPSAIATRSATRAARRREAAPDKRAVPVRDRDEHGQRDEGDGPVRRPELEDGADDDESEPHARRRRPKVGRARPASPQRGRLALATLLTQLPPQVVERSRARHVGHLVEVVRWRRRRRVPLEGVRLPGVVATRCAATPRLQDVDREEQERRPP